MADVPFLGCKISLISKCDIRYEGILYCVDPKESTISLSKVRSYGTETRGDPANFVPPKNDVYDIIIFRASDVKDLRVDAPEPPGLSDPAIISARQGSSSTTTLDANPPRSREQQQQPQPQQHHDVGRPRYNNVTSNRREPRQREDDNKVGPPHRRGDDNRSRGDQVSHRRDHSNHRRDHSNNRGEQTNHRNHRDQASRGPNQRGPNPRGPHPRGPNPRGRQNLRPRGEMRGGRRGRSSGAPLRFEGEYDFDEANKIFMELGCKFKDLKVKDGKKEENGGLSGERDNSKSPTGQSESNSGYDDDHKDGDSKERFGGSQSGEYYDKSKSFFDNISCEANERGQGKMGRPDWRKERQTNAETFGISANYRRGGYRGRSYGANGYHRR